MTATVSWSGGPVNTSIFFITGIATCYGPTGIVEHINASSGSFTVSLAEGTTYTLYACNQGVGQAQSFTYNVTTGYTWGDLLATFFLLIGVPLVFVAFRKPRYTS